MKYLLCFMMLAGLGWACKQRGASTEKAPTEASSLIGEGLFEMEAIPGSNYRLAKSSGINGAILEEGITDAKGKKNGIWVTYQGNGGYPAKVANYVNGVYNGPYFEFDGFGRMSVRASYVNNKLHGLLVKFSNGNRTQETPYVNGVLDGMYKEYNYSGSIQKEISYKNGQLDGPFRYYDDEGKVTIEYLYKAGKKQ